MKKLIAILLILFAVQLYAQESIEIAPGVKPAQNSVQDDSLNLFFSFPTIAFIGEYGAETDGNIVYATQWLDDSLASYDLYGNIIERFTISGVERVRDLAYDGQYYYGSPSDYFFYVLDLDNKNLVATYNTPFRIRGMAYDPVEDVLWASEHWSPMFYKMDKQGNLLDSLFPAGITMDAISGLAYDNTSYGGPFLWGFSQDGSGAMIVKYDIAGQTQTGNMIDVSGLVTNMTVAGGLYLEEVNEPSGTIIGGVIQNLLHFALELNYANTLVGMDEPDHVVSLLQVYPNPVLDVMNIRTDVDYAGEYSISVINQLGEVMLETTRKIDRNTPATLDVSALENGFYFLRVVNGRQTITARFVVGHH